MYSSLGTKLARHWILTVKILERKILGGSRQTRAMKKPADSTFQDFSDPGR
jgi:hypothetical protein